MKYLIIVTFFMISCGNPEIILENNVYEPKIVIDGYLFVGKPIQQIAIKRNISSGTSIDAIDLFVDDAEVFITDLSTNTRVQLTYNADPFVLSYYDELTVLGNIKPNTEYRIDVNAKINGDDLSANSTTKTPSLGFKAHETADSVKVYPRNEDERDNNQFKIGFDKSKGAEIYILQFRPLDKRFETLIQTPRNIYLEDEYDRKKYEEEKNDFESSGEIINLDDIEPDYDKDIKWFRFHYASRYQVLMLAGDQNYKDFYSTFDQVQDFDGNIDEPKFHVNGDGIGIFGSVIADTLYYRVQL